MTAHKIEAVVDAGHGLQLTDLPFEAGQAVEVIVIATSKSALSGEFGCMKGTLISCDDLLGPLIDPSDWEANRP